MPPVPIEALREWNHCYNLLPIRERINRGPILPNISLTGIGKVQQHRWRSLSRNGHGRHSFPQFENLTVIDSTSRLTACWSSEDTPKSRTGICGNSLAAKSRLPLCFYSPLRIFRTRMYRSQTRKNHYLSSDCSDPISRVLTPETLQFHYGHIPIAHHQTIDPSQGKRQ
jgi:hypothetical protein